MAKSRQKYAIRGRERTFPENPERPDRYAHPERAGDGIALKLPRIKRRKEQHKARARMRKKCTERTAKKEQAKTGIRVFCGRRRGRGRFGV